MNIYDLESRTCRMSLFPDGVPSTAHRMHAAALTALLCSRAHSTPLFPKSCASVGRCFSIHTRANRHKRHSGRKQMIKEMFYYLIVFFFSYFGVLLCTRMGGRRGVVYIVSPFRGLRFKVSLAINKIQSAVEMGYNMMAFFFS